MKAFILLFNEDWDHVSDLSAMMVKGHVGEQLSQEEIDGLWID